MKRKQAHDILRNDNNDDSVLVKESKNDKCLYNLDATKFKGEDRRAIQKAKNSYNYRQKRITLIENLEEKIASLRTEIGEVKADRDAKVTNFRSALEDRDAKITNLQSALDDLDGKYLKLQGALDDRDAIIATKEAENTYFKQKIFLLETDRNVYQVGVKRNNAEIDIEMPNGSEYEMMERKRPKIDDIQIADDLMQLVMDDLGPSFEVHLLDCLDTLKEPNSGSLYDEDDVHSCKTLEGTMCTIDATQLKFGDNEECINCSSKDKSIEDSSKQVEKLMELIDALKQRESVCICNSQQYIVYDPPSDEVEEVFGETVSFVSLSSAYKQDVNLNDHNMGGSLTCVPMSEILGKFIHGEDMDN